MHPVIKKTFGGLSPQYYFRQLFFGVILCAIFLYPLSREFGQLSFGILVFMAINTLLYPYSRFSYEGVVNFIVGNNVFFGNAGAMLLAKLLTMLMCWVFAILIAPTGLIYLYFHHSKVDRQEN